MLLSREASNALVPILQTGKLKLDQIKRLVWGGSPGSKVGGKHTQAWILWRHALPPFPLLGVSSRTPGVKKKSSRKHKGALLPPALGCVPAPPLTCGSRMPRPETAVPGLARSVFGCLRALLPVTWRHYRLRDTEESKEGVTIDLLLRHFPGETTSSEWFNQSPPAASSRNTARWCWWFWTPVLCWGSLKRVLIHHTNMGPAAKHKSSHKIRKRFWTFCPELTFCWRLSDAAKWTLAKF